MTAERIDESLSENPQLQNKEGVTLLEIREKLKANPNIIVAGESFQTYLNSPFGADQVQILIAPKEATFNPKNLTEVLQVSLEGLVPEMFELPSLIRRHEMVKKCANEVDEELTHRSWDILRLGKVVFKETVGEKIDYSWSETKVDSEFGQRSKLKTSQTEVKKQITEFLRRTTVQLYPNIRLAGIKLGAINSMQRRENGATKLLICLSDEIPFVYQSLIEEYKDDESLKNAILNFKPYEGYNIVQVGKVERF